MNEMKFEHGIIIMEGKRYCITMKDGKPIIREMNTKEQNIYNEQEKLSSELAMKLKDNVDAEIVMKEALRLLPLKDLKKLDTMLKSKRKYKPKTREGHCADMKVGGFIIPLVGGGG